MGSPKNADNHCKLLESFTRWRCQGPYGDYVVSTNVYNYMLAYLKDHTHYTVGGKCILGAGEMKF